MAENLRGKRILVVEDSPLLAFNVEFLMEQYGALPIGPALDLSTALNLAEEHTLDGAVLDINLGDDQVWPLAETLLARGVPLLILSANCTEYDIPEAFRTCPCLDKPARDTEIVQRLSAALA